MAHSLIIGMTESGKTTLAKQLAQSYANNGIRVLVFDPMYDDEWVADFQTANFDDMIREYEASTKCAVFFDEAGTVSKQHDEFLIKTATQGRHRGHANHYISQRGAMVPKTLRDQCSHLFIFGQSLDDAKTYAREYNSPEILTVAKFRKGEYYHATRFDDATKGKLF